MSVHFHDKAREVVDALNRAGFRGIMVTAEFRPLTDEELELDGFRPEEIATYRRSYAAFRVQAAMPYADDFMPEGNLPPYVEVTVDVNEHQFWQDLLGYLREQFEVDGKTVTLTRHEAGDIEVTREGHYPKDLDARPRPELL